MKSVILLILVLILLITNLSVASNTNLTKSEQVEHDYGAFFYFFVKLSANWASFYGDKELRQNYEKQIPELAKSLKISLEPKLANVHSRQEARKACANYLRICTERAKKLNSEYIFICLTLGSSCGIATDTMMSIIGNSKAPIDSRLHQTLIKNLNYVKDDLGDLKSPAALSEKLSEITTAISKAKTSSEIKDQFVEFQTWNLEVTKFMFKDVNPKASTEVKN